MILLVAVPCLGCTTFFYNTTTPTLTPFLVEISLLLEVGQLLLVSFLSRHTELTIGKTIVSALSINSSSVSVTECVVYNTFA